MEPSRRQLLTWFASIPLLGVLPSVMRPDPAEADSGKEFRIEPLCAAGAGSFSGWCE